VWVMAIKITQAKLIFNVHGAGFFKKKKSEAMWTRSPPGRRGRHTPANHDLLGTKIKTVRKIDDGGGVWATAKTKEKKHQ